MCLKKCQVIVELNIAAKLLSTEHSPEILGCKSQSKPIIDIFSPLWSMHMLLVTVNAFYRYSNFKENFLKSCDFLKSVAKQENNQSNCSFFYRKSRMQIIVFFMKDWANSFYLFLLQSFVWDLNVRKHFLFFRPCRKMQNFELDSTASTLSLSWLSKLWVWTSSPHLMR